MSRQGLCNDRRLMIFELKIAQGGNKSLPIWKSCGKSVLQALWQNQWVRTCCGVLWCGDRLPPWDVTVPLWGLLSRSGVCVTEGLSRPAGAVRSRQQDWCHSQQWHVQLWGDIATGMTGWRQPDVNDITPVTTLRHCDDITTIVTCWRHTPTPA